MYLEPFFYSLITNLSNSLNTKGLRAIDNNDEAKIILYKVSSKIFILRAIPAKMNENSPT